MIRHLVLCGLGPGHLRLLAYLAQQPARSHADIGISLLTRQRRYVSDAALLKTVGSPLPADPRETLERFAHQTRTEAAQLERMAQKGGVRWVDAVPQAIDPANKTMLLDDGRTLRFDWLSVEPEAVQHRDQIDQTVAGARANGLFVRPREAFCKLWPQVQVLAAGKPLRFTLVLNLKASLPNGARPETQETTLPTPLQASPQALPPPAPDPVHLPFLRTSAAQATAHWASEKFALALAFAIHHAFKGSAVTLITGGAAIGEGMAPALQACVQAALKKRQITVLPDTACAIAPGEVLLQSGARLACDVPMVIYTPVLPDWLLRSGLALDAQGQLLTDRASRSSQPHIFVNVQDTQASARQLFQGLRAVIAGRAPAAGAVSVAQPLPSKNSVYRLDCGDGRSIVAWRNWATESWHLSTGHR